MHAKSLISPSRLAALAIGLSNISLTQASFAQGAEALPLKVVSGEQKKAEPEKIELDAAVINTRNSPEDFAQTRKIYGPKLPTNHQLSQIYTYTPLFQRKGDEVKVSRSFDSFLKLATIAEFKLNNDERYRYRSEVIKELNGISIDRVIHSVVWDNKHFLNLFDGKPDNFTLIDRVKILSSDKNDAGARVFAIIKWCELNSMELDDDLNPNHRPIPLYINDVTTRNALVLLPEWDTDILLKEVQNNFAGLTGYSYLKYNGGILLGRDRAMTELPNVIERCAFYVSKDTDFALQVREEQSQKGINLSVEDVLGFIRKNALKYVSLRESEYFATPITAVVDKVRKQDIASYSVWHQMDFPSISHEDPEGPKEWVRWYLCATRPAGSGPSSEKERNLATQAILSADTDGTILKALKYNLAFERLDNGTESYPKPPVFSRWYSAIKDNLDKIGLGFLALIVLIGSRGGGGRDGPLPPDNLGDRRRFPDGTYKSRKW